MQGTDVRDGGEHRIGKPGLAGSGEAILARGFTEQRYVHREFNALKMEPDEDPKKLISTVDQTAKELRRLGGTVSEHESNVTTIMM